MLSYFSKHANTVLAVAIILSIVGIALQFTQREQILQSSILSLFALFSFLLMYSFPQIASAINKVNANLMNQQEPKLFLTFLKTLFYVSLVGTFLSFVGILSGDMEAPFSIAPTSGLLAGICRYLYKTASV